MNLQNADLTGVGFKSFDEDKSNKNEHFFSIKLSDDVMCLGLFVGFRGDKTCKFIVENFPKELKNLFKRDDDVISMLKNILECLESKTKGIRQNLSKNSLNEMDYTSGLVLFISHCHIYLVNLGFNRVLLRRRKNHHIETIQLNKEVGISEEEEEKPRWGLGVDSEGSVSQQKFFSENQKIYSKPGQNFLSPWMSDPLITGPFPFNPEKDLLVLLSSGIISKIKKGGFGPEEVNEEIIRKVEHQMAIQPSMAQLAQTIVDEVAFFGSHTNTAQKIHIFSQDPYYNKLIILVHCFINPFLSESFSLSNFKNLPPLSIDIDQDVTPSVTSSLSFSQNSIDSSSETNKKINSYPPIDAYVDFKQYYQITSKMPKELLNDYQIILDFVSKN